MASSDPIPRNDGVKNHEPVVSATPNPEHMWHRSRVFQEALIAADIDPRLQNGILYIAHHCDIDGVVRNVSLAYLAKKLGYRSRGGPQYVIDAAQEAGFLTVERDPRDKRKTIYRIEMMAAPPIARPKAAQLRDQLRGERGFPERNCAAQGRAPSIEEVHIEEGRETDITREVVRLTPDTIREFRLARRNGIGHAP